MAFYTANTCKSAKTASSEPSNRHRRQRRLLGGHALPLSPWPPSTPCLGRELLRTPRRVSAARRSCLRLRQRGRRNPAWLGAFSFLRREPLSPGAAVLQPTGSQRGRTAFSLATAAPGCNCQLLFPFLPQVPTSGSGAAFQSGRSTPASWKPKG